jgi:hypothetical protein
MRKEVIFAILLGISLAGLFLYGLFLSSNATKNIKEKETIKKQNQITPEPIPESVRLLLLSPANHTVSFKELVNIKGQSGPNSPIAIITEDDEKIINADDKGVFEFEAALIGGENIISFATPGKNILLEDKITIIYTTAEVNLDSKQATDEAKTTDIKDQVKGVIDSIIKGESATTLTGIVGIVESIDDETINLNSDDELYQISTTDSTSLLNGKKEIGIKDIAIDDKLIIIGTNKDSEFIIDAARVLVVSNKEPEISRLSIYGTIKDINEDGDLITIIPAGQDKDIEIDIPSKYKPDTDGITIGASLLAIIERDNTDQTHTLLTHKIL